jgi:hypothetical protein
VQRRMQALKAASAATIYREKVNGALVSTNVLGPPVI